MKQYFFCLPGDFQIASIIVGELDFNISFGFLMIGNREVHIGSVTLTVDIRRSTLRIQVCNNVEGFASSDGDVLILGSVFNSILPNKFE